MNGVSIRKRSTLYRKSAATIRWLHIYLSMLGFTALMFFSLTGITLNHPTWFGASEQRIVDEDGQLPVDWMEEDSAAGINQLMIAEHLRQEHSLRGRVTEFETSEFDVMVVFKSPGYAADVFINRDDGRYTVTTITSGVVSIMNDLHKGRDSGPGWSILIDASAVILMLFSISGFALLLYLKRRRLNGIVVATLGTIAMIAVWGIWVH